MLEFPLEVHRQTIDESFHLTKFPNVFVYMRALHYQLKPASFQSVYFPLLSKLSTVAVITFLAISAPQGQQLCSAGRLQ